MNVFPHNVKLISTQRFIEGGRSKGNFKNFNLALHTHDYKDDVKLNRILLENYFGLPSPPIWLNQIHSNISIKAHSSSSLFNADASFSNETGIVCAILTADCLPVFISNKKGTTVGIAHAGWRGLVDGIIESLIESFEVNSEELMVHLGPAISQLSFEVGEEIKLQYLSKNKNFESCFIFENGKYYLDLYGAARIVLKDLGVNSISGGENCTYNEPEKYFSYRRDGEFSGRMAHLIWMEKF